MNRLAPLPAGALLAGLAVAAQAQAPQPLCSIEPSGLDAGAAPRRHLRIPEPLTACSFMIERRDVGETIRELDVMTPPAGGELSFAVARHAAYVLVTYRPAPHFPGYDRFVFRMRGHRDTTFIEVTVSR